MKRAPRVLFFLILSLAVWAAGESPFREADASRWLKNGYLTPEARATLNDIVSDSSLLCSKERYRLGEIEELSQLAPLDETARLRLTKLLEESFRLYRHDTRYGCLNPSEIYPEHLAIERCKETNGTGSNLLLERLLKALKRYEKIAERGGWPSVPADFRLLRPGDSGVSVEALCSRLAVTGDYNGSCATVTLYDDPLVEAVRRFQTRHGLKSDGIVGPATLRWLNVPVESKIRTIRLNIERLRWLTDESPDFVAVNIPDFRLTLYRRRQPVLSMKAIVGSRKRPTPLLCDTLTYAVLNPYWRAPKTIVEEDILPKLRAGEFDALRKKGIVAVRTSDPEVPVDLASVDWSRYGAKNLPYLFMQKPGPHNYLGFVKFMFPNDFDVYLHDTNHDELFQKRYRARSSGCVRVEKPLELFRALFDPENGGEWTCKRIHRTLSEGRERLVGLKYPIPVFLLYMTAFVDDGGRVHFRRDIYGYDAMMNDSLNKL